MTPGGPLPPVYFLAALLLQVGTHFVVPLAHVVPGPWSLAGLLLIGGGLAVTLAADQQFTRARTTVKPFGTPTTLVTDGVFRFSRNPMYLGLVLALLGVAIALGTAMPFALPVAFAVLVNARFIPHEERTLATAFGEAWTAYARGVRRWL